MCYLFFCDSFINHNLFYFRDEDKPSVNASQRTLLFSTNTSIQLKLTTSMSLAYSHIYCHHLQYIVKNTILYVIKKPIYGSLFLLMFRIRLVLIYACTTIVRCTQRKCNLVLAQMEMSQLKIRLKAYLLHHRLQASMQKKIHHHHYIHQHHLHHHRSIKLVSCCGLAIRSLPTL